MPIVTLSPDFKLYSYEEKHSLLRNSNGYQLLRDRTRGIEKESLRVDLAGNIAQTPHPQSLGSALTNSAITTDFSEALLEFITPPHSSLKAVFDELHDIHTFVYQRLVKERLWVASMPCEFGDGASIPIAQYGSSNVAKMKSTYRQGLASRYGKSMQAIAGIHFNFSFSDEFWAVFHRAAASRLSLMDFKTDRYFSLIRNFHTTSWLLVYLFGASPALCKSFVKGAEHGLEETAAGDLVGKYATSLRMGDLGYTSSAQDDLFVCYNTVESYIQTLVNSLTTAYPAFSAIGVRNAGGDYEQLSDAILQIENEYYSTIRPKRTTHSGETPINALQSRGVEYIEVRCLDLNPYEPLGIDGDTAKFVELYLVHCLLDDDYSCDKPLLLEGRENLKTVITNGRKPDLVLSRHGADVRFKDWSLSIMDKLQFTAESLESTGEEGLQDLVQRMRARITDPSLTPSARIYDDLMASPSLSYADFVARLSSATNDYFMAQSLANEQETRFSELASASLQQQCDIESKDSISFEQYIDNYYRQYQLLEKSA